MSTEQGGATPSFGDLFEDPDADAVVPAPTATASPSGTGSGLDEAQRRADAGAGAEDRAAHDLDHVSVEAAHLTASFEDVPDEPPGTDENAAAEPVAAAPDKAWDGTVDPSVAAAPAAHVDTGRLYRSSGAEGPATLDAIPAIDPDRPRSTVGAVAATAPPVAGAVAGRGSAGLTYSGVLVLVTGVTVLAAFVEALVRDQIGWVTGAALLVSSVYAAVVVRRPDIWAAVVAPPLAFLVAALTAGQIVLRGETGSFVVRQGYGLFKALAVNAPWILGTTAICLVVVLVRRRRA